MSKRESLQERRRAALEAYFDARPRQLTAICKRAGVSPETVRGFLAGESQTLTLATYDKIAQSEEVPLALLLGEMEDWGEPISRPDSDIAVTIPDFEATVPVEIDGRVQAGLFAEADELPENERDRLSIPKSVPYADKPLRGFRVYGDSMNEFYPHGSFVIVVPWIHMGDGWMPRAEQHVIVERRNEWGEREYTIKEIGYGPGDPPAYLELVPRSTNKAFGKAWRFPIRRDEDAGDEENMRIVGLVIYSLNAAPGV